MTGPNFITHRDPRRFRRCWLICGWLACLCGGAATGTLRVWGQPLSLSGPRQPIKIVATADGLATVNRRSGTISLLRRAGDAVAAEQQISERLSDFLAIPGRDLFVAADDQSSELIVLRQNGLEFQTLQRQAAAPQPVSLLIAEGEDSLTVASQWAHQLSKWTLTVTPDGPRLIHQQSLDLPFAPGLQCAGPDADHLIVADAFGPHLAVIRRNPFTVHAIYQIPGHNLRGLALHQPRRELMVTHQMLNDFIPTTRDHVFWGNVISNLLRSLSWDRLLSPPVASHGVPSKIHGSLFPLGQEGRAAGDPEQIAVTPDGTILVALAGTGEIAIRRPDERRFTRLAVGRRPTGLWVAPDGQTAWVANRFDDTVAIVDLDRREVAQTLSLGPSAPSTAADQGERLFYDASLSLHGWFSCHSCHTHGHTCGLLNDNFGDDTLGSPKRIPSLLGTRETGPWAWNGGQLRLADQVHKSLQLTMRGGEQRTPTAKEEHALVCFLETLRPPPSVAAARGQLEMAAITRGERLFRHQECDHCHVPPSYTSADVYDVGLRDERGRREFNPPSLRGVGQRPRFFHDNRAGSLRDVLTNHPHPHGPPLSHAEQDDLIAFLQSL